MEPVSSVSSLSLSGGEGVVAGDIGEVPGVVEGDDADIVAPADLEPVDPAVGGDQPGSLLGVPADRPHQVQCHEADSSGVREDGNPFALMFTKDLPKFVHGPFYELTIALAASYHVMVVAINESEIVFRMVLLGFVEGKTLQYSDITLAERGFRQYGHTDKPRQGLGGLNGTVKIAGIDSSDALSG